MRGHVRKRGKGWVVVTDIGRDEDGKRRQRWHSGYATRKEAESALAEIVGKLGRGDYVAPTKLTFGDYLRDKWLPHLTSQVNAGNLRPTTAGFYRQLVEAHVLAGVGGVRLRSLDAPSLNRFYGELLRSGRKVISNKDLPGLSLTTVHSIHVTIGKALGDAVRWGLLERNVATLADPPGRAKTERRIWSAKQVSTFSERSKTDRLCPLWLLAVTTGASARRVGWVAMARGRLGQRDAHRSWRPSQRPVQGSRQCPEDSEEPAHDCPGTDCRRGTQGAPATSTRGALGVGACLGRYRVRFHS